MTVMVNLSTLDDHSSGSFERRDPLRGALASLDQPLFGEPVYRIRHAAAREQDFPLNVAEQERTLVQQRLDLTPDHRADATGLPSEQVESFARVVLLPEPRSGSPCRAGGGAIGGDVLRV